MKTYRDHYFNKAKRENYPARSVYKLQEINKRFKVLKPGAKILDLGAAPGSWTLFAAKVVGGKGRVLGVDLSATETEFPENVTFLVADAFSPSAEMAAAMDGLAPFDVVLSDMAPKTTGIKFRDQAYSLELCEEAYAIARKVLAPGGSLVVKFFEGPDVKAYLDGLRKAFASVKTFKPKSSREESKEMFVIGLGYKENEHKE
jgi:23S rRNA (uridine2552-2'-O)-methyltransferase